MIKGNHFDYVHQAWTLDGRYVRCGHPQAMYCDCYGKAHQGELANVNDLPTAPDEPSPLGMESGRLLHFNHP